MGMGMGNMGKMSLAKGNLGIIKNYLEARGKSVILNSKKE